MKVLLVDDDDVLRGRLEKELRKRNCNIVSAGNASEVADVIRDTSIDAAVVDLRLPDGTGLQLVELVHEQYRDARIIVLTGYGSIATAVEAMRLGAHDYLSKPCSMGRIWEALTAEDTSTDATPEVSSLERAEWEHIQRALADSDGNVSEAARRLGIHRRSLQRKLSRRPPPD
jgi:two-component system, response regulator RegA